MNEMMVNDKTNFANKLYYHSAPILWNSLPSDLPHGAHNVTPSPILNSPVSSDLST